MTKNRSRVLSWIVLVVFSLVILCSSAFIITHADHDCSGEDCPVCIELAECHNTLHPLGTAFMGGVHLAVMTLALAVIISSFTKVKTDHTTLISLKVELLN